MNNTSVMEEDWSLLASFFPANWRKIARETSALKGLRQDKSEEKFLRTLLMHFACGYSLRETALRAREARLADLSDVALLKRLRKSKEWLYELCRRLFAERELSATGSSGLPLRLIDATVVKEPGPTGSLWRVHYSLQWPSLRCSFFKLTATEGEGTGESLGHFPVKAGEYLLADRGYCRATSIHHVAARGAYLTVRLNPDTVRIANNLGQPLDLLGSLSRVRKTNAVACWPVMILGSENQTPPIPGRICVVRKTCAAIERAKSKLRRKASKNGTALQPETLVYAEYVMVFTTFPPESFSASGILEFYRLRWQIELVFKRFKQLASLGHLPKHDDQSAQAWLYGKLFVALLTEKLITEAESFSPWGYDLAKTQNAEPLA
jgi:hypothetical protein